MPKGGSQIPPAESDSPLMDLICKLKGLSPQAQKAEPEGAVPHLPRQLAIGKGIRLPSGI